MGPEVKTWSSRQAHNGVDDLICGLSRDRLIALRAERHSEPGEKDPQEIVDFSHRPHCRAGISGRRVLLQGNGRRQALDLFHLGFVHLGQELSGVDRQGFHIPALALGIDDVKSQGGLARTAGSANHDQPVPGDDHIDIFQIVVGCLDDLY